MKGAKKKPLSPPREPALKAGPTPLPGKPPEGRCRARHSASLAIFDGPFTLVTNLTHPPSPPPPPPSAAPCETAPPPPPPSPAARPAPHSPPPPRSCPRHRLRACRSGSRRPITRDASQPEPPRPRAAAAPPRGGSPGDRGRPPCPTRSAAPEPDRPPPLPGGAGSGPRLAGPCP